MVNFPDITQIAGITANITTPIISTIQKTISGIVGYIYLKLGEFTDLFLMAIAVVIGIKVMKTTFKFTIGVIMIASLIYLTIRLGAIS